MSEWEKSQARSASVGTVCTLLDGWVARHRSYAKKLKSLFFYDRTADRPAENILPDNIFIPE